MSACRVRGEGAGGVVTRGNAFTATVALAVLLGALVHGFPEH